MWITGLKSWKTWNTMGKTNTNRTKMNTICGSLSFWVSTQYVLYNLFVAVSVCGLFGLWPFQFFWPFRFVAISDFGLWPFQSVAFLVCSRFGLGYLNLGCHDQKPTCRMRLKQNLGSHAVMFIMLKWLIPYYFSQLWALIHKHPLLIYFWLFYFTILCSTRKFSAFVDNTSLLLP